MSCFGDCCLWLLGICITNFVLVFVFAFVFSELHILSTYICLDAVIATTSYHRHFIQALAAGEMP